MNPFRYLAPTVQHILAYPKTSINSTICTHMIDEKLFKLIQEDLLSSFRSSAASIGEDKLGFKPEDIGTPLLNSSTWRRIYFRNASDDHRTMSIIM